MNADSVLWIAISFPFLASLIFFVLIMWLHPRSLWSGTAALGLLIGTALSIVFVFFRYSQQIVSNQLLTTVLVGILLMVLAFLAIFPFGLAALFIIEGIRLIRKEGFSMSNCLSLGFGIAILLDIFALPLLNRLDRYPVASLLYMMLTITVGFLSIQLAVFCLSALVNLIHIRNNQGFDQIVVLGSAVLGDRVPPLLANRIARGIELQKKNPGALLILSGGQGPGENLPEGAAMKAWALEHGADPERTVSEEQSVNTRENLICSARLFAVPGGKTAIVTTRYHVFRALVLSRELAIPARGFGSKTKWYFTLNAILREFAAYLSMTKKMQIRWLLVLLFPFLFTMLVSMIFR